MVVRSYFGGAGLDEVVEPPPPDAPPARPTDLTAPVASITKTTVLLVWDRNAEVDVTGYRIYRVDGWVPTQIGTEPQPGSGTTVDFTVSSLTANTTYTFQVKAEDAASQLSGASNSVTCKTDPPSQPDPPPAGLIIKEPEFDLSGDTDESNAVHDFIALNADNGPNPNNRPRVKIAPKRLNGTRSKLRLEGGTNGGIVITKTNVIFDGGGDEAHGWQNGAQIIQTNPRPFIAKATPGSGSGEWDVWYAPNGNWSGGTPTDGAVLKRTFANEVAAKGNRDILNRDRKVFRLKRSHQVSIVGCDVLSCFDPSDPNKAELEAQDFVQLEGGQDCEIARNRIRQFFGNGIECQVYADTNDGPHDEGCLLGNGDHAATTEVIREYCGGTWIHHNTITDCGRQWISITYAFNTVVDHNKFDDSARSGIDSEPVASSIGDQHYLLCNGGPNDGTILQVYPATRPQPTQTVDGVWVTDNIVGQHGLGFYALHPQTKNIYIARNKGYQLGLTAQVFAQRVIVENNEETSHNPSPHAYVFARAEGGNEDIGNHQGQDWGGRDIIVRNNIMNGSSHNELVFLDGQLGGCQRYLVQGNQYAGATRSPGHPAGEPGGREWWDEHTPDWTGTPPNFTLPLPPHALR